MDGVSCPPEQMAHRAGDGGFWGAGRLLAMADKHADVIDLASRRPVSVPERVVVRVGSAGSVVSVDGVPVATFDGAALAKFSAADVPELLADRIRAALPD